MSEKQQAAKEIATLVTSFCSEHLNDELRACALKLCDTLSRKRKLNICRGRKEIWAAAIIYVIARLNFLFDKSSPCPLSVDTICDFFGTKKPTTSNKANLIEEACDMDSNEADYCTDEVNESFSQRPNGFIEPAPMLSGISYEVADEEESKAIEAYLAEQRRLEEEASAARNQRRTEINRKTAEKKKAKGKIPATRTFRRLIRGHWPATPWKQPSSSTGSDGRRCAPPGMPDRSEKTNAPKRRTRYSSDANSHFAEINSRP